MNSRDETLRKKRLRDFEQRAKAERDSLREVPDLGSYVAVNPMADESELLKKLGMTRDTCIKVDLYWANRGDVMFVQVMTRSYAVSREAGLYARLTPTGYVNVVVVVPDDAIDSSIIALALNRIMSSKIETKSLGDTLQILKGPALT